VKLPDLGSILSETKITFVWEFCQLGFGPIGLSSRQKYRRPNYPLALVGRHPNSGQIVRWSFGKKSILKYFGAFLPVLTRSADRVYQKKQKKKTALTFLNLGAYMIYHLFTSLLSSR
jgi:hypothetical protein